MAKLNQGGVHPSQKNQSYIIFVCHAWFATKTSLYYFSSYLGTRSSELGKQAEMEIAGYLLIDGVSIAGYLFIRLVTYIS